MYQKQQSGMVIVLAILIIAAVIATAAAFGNLVIREIRQTRLIDQSIQAYYFAESGSERALHQVRKREAIVDCSSLNVITPAVCDPVTSHCSNELDAPCINIGNLGTWNTAVSKEREIIITLSEGQTFQVDLFDISQTAESGINRIEVGRRRNSNRLDDVIQRLIGEHGRQRTSRVPRHVFTRKN